MGFSDKMKKTLIATLIIALTMINLCGTAMNTAASDVVPLQTMDTITTIPSNEIFISEFLYDPLGLELEGEFIELQNMGTEHHNILNWTLSDQDGGVDMVFPNITLAPGEFAVVHVNCGIPSYNATEGAWYLFMNKTSSLLTGTGDDILLRNNTDHPVDFISYGDGSSVDLPPMELGQRSNLSFISEGYSYVKEGDRWSQSLPTPGSLSRNISGVLITAVCPDAKLGGEFIQIMNPTNGSIDLSMCGITDGEGLAVFDKGTVILPGEVMAIADNGTRYYEMTLQYPEFAYTGRSIMDGLSVPKSSPTMANDGDEIFLVNTGLDVADAFVFGDSTHSGEGWTGAAVKVDGSYEIVKRMMINGTYLDTDSSLDWDMSKTIKAGQSSVSSGYFQTSGQTTAFVSPDCSMDAIIDIIENAEIGISLNLYEFTDYNLATSLHTALSRGVDVMILVDGSPVGGMPDAEEELLSWLSLAGAQVHTQNPSNPKIETRYNFNHAKYMVADNSTTIVMTENWKKSGVPVPGTTGNRGWGVAIDDEGLAEYFSHVFYNDWKVDWEDVHEFEPNTVSDIFNPMMDKTLEPIFEQQTSTSTSNVTAVIYPDMSLTPEDPLMNLINSAEDTILVEQFYIDLHWGKRNADGSWPQLNPYLAALIDAARRGCSVKVLLDSSDYNIKFEDYNDNDDTVAYLNSLAETEELDIEARLVRSGTHIFTKVHTKGMVVDGSKTLISSINWNENSCTRNREVGIIVENGEIADYFTQVFGYDWKDEMEKPRPVITATGVLMTNMTINFSASSSTCGYELSNYSWDMDFDGIADSFDMNTTWVFDEPGDHNVTLSISDIYGNVDHTYLMIRIEATIFDIDHPDTDQIETEILEEVTLTSEDQNMTGTLDQVAEEKADDGSDLTILYILPLLVLIGSVVWRKLRRSD